MDWISFSTGILSAAMAFALFSGSEKEDVEIDEEMDSAECDYSVRHVTLSCQTCRKLKRHKEVSHNLFQCVKCKRHVDLRVS